MKSILYLTFVLLFCSCIINKSKIVSELEFYNLKELNIEIDSVFSFRNSLSEINWEWYNDANMCYLPDSFVYKYFGDIKELNKWTNYQKFYSEGYFIQNDTLTVLILNNQIQNGNESNKYLICIDEKNDLSSLFLLAQITKSPVDLSEISSVLRPGRIVQEDIYIEWYDNVNETTKILKEYKTENFINYKSSVIDSTFLREYLSE